jgi:hypothetical protein
MLVAVLLAEDEADFVSCEEAEFVAVADGRFHTPLIEIGQFVVFVGSHGGIDTEENTVPFGGKATTATIPASALI